LSYRLNSAWLILGSAAASGLMLLRGVSAAHH
jgi:hypothetical protein